MFQICQKERLGLFIVRVCVGGGLRLFEMGKVLMGGTPACFFSGEVGELLEGRLEAIGMGQTPDPTA